MATNKPKHILFAPLDWGLGHTTRCVPLIRYIQSLGHVPVVACNASQRSFIEETFGNIDIIHLGGYNITYSKWNKLAQFGLLSQLPGIRKTIKTEHKWLLQLAKDRQIDGIISDNRYGLFHPGIPSVILTHQLQVQTGFGNIPNRAVQKMHYKYLDHFNTVWAPDAPGDSNLGGKLSHPVVLPSHTKYIGLLSRFAEMSISNNNSDNLLILLSGPEPQRSALAQILWKQAEQYNGSITFIEGSENAATPTAIPSHITYHKRLTNQRLFPILNDAAMVICRSGYSTLMDLVALHKKAIIIPTPGQTEQEYLGRHLHAQGILYCTPQKGFDLQSALKEAHKFSYNALSLDDAYSAYKKVLEDWVTEL